MRTLRHQLRTPVNHITGFSEMLQEEAADRGWDGLLPDLERIRQAGRGLMDAIGRVEGGTLDPERISRDLRTPLESIIGYSQLLQEEAGESGWAEALPDLRKVEAAAQHLTTLIATVLDLTRLYAEDALRAAEARGASVAGAASSGSILLADDDDVDAELMSRRIEQVGHSVRRVASGPEALALLEQHEPFDLLLLDVLMPGQDGIETLRAIRQLPAGQSLPVLMISALEEIPIVVRCIELGADDYLVKPVDPVLLQAKLHASLERRRLRDGERHDAGDLAALTAAVAALGRGEYAPGSLAAVVAREDALGRLARVFDRAAASLQQRLG